MTGILIGTQEAKCVFRETAVVGTLFQESEWQHQQNSGVTASHGEAAAVTSEGVCVCMCVYVESK